MAKYMSGATVTVENDTGRYVFKTQGVSVSSTNGGQTHNVSVSPDAQMVENGVPYFIPFAQGGTTPKSAATTKREAVIKHVLEMAKAVEKQKFEGARLVELAEAEVIDVTNERLHAFNLAVLSALHEGLNESQVRNALLAAGLADFDEDVVDVSNRDTKALYPRVEDDSED